MNGVKIEEKGGELYLYGIAGLQGCRCYDWGENLLLVKDDEDGKHLVNKLTGKVRKISEPGFLVGFSDEEIDFETLDKLENTHNAHPRRIEYGGIGRWNDCSDGLIVLCWTLYPDGRYFGDEDGFGMEDNDEVEAYCVMDENLEVIRPFTVVDNVQQLLSDVAREREATGVKQQIDKEMKIRQIMQDMFDLEPCLDQPQDSVDGLLRTNVILFYLYTNFVIRDEAFYSRLEAYHQQLVKLQADIPDWLQNITDSYMRYKTGLERGDLENPDFASRELFFDVMCTLQKLKENGEYLDIIKKDYKK